MICQMNRSIESASDLSTVNLNGDTRQRLIAGINVMTRMKGKGSFYESKLNPG